MTHGTIRRALPALVVAATLAFAGGVARAQDGQGPSPQEIEQKIREIEKLMKKAEQSLARSTDARRSAESSAEAKKRLEELLDEKAQAQTGKSASELRKEAEQGSTEASEALKRLMEEARKETAEAGAEMERLIEGGGTSSREAAEGVRKLLEETKQSGAEAEAGIRWLLENAVTQSGSGSGGGGGKKPEKQDQQKKPEQQGDPEDQPQDPDHRDQPTAKKPQHELEPPRTPEFEVWLAELPPQVRRAYESKDWDAIPAKWRTILRDWTKKMADDLERDR